MTDKERAVIEAAKDLVSGWKKPYDIDTLRRAVRALDAPRFEAVPKDIQGRCPWELRRNGREVVATFVNETLALDAARLLNEHYERGGE